MMTEGDAGLESGVHASRSGSWRHGIPSQGWRQPRASLEGIHGVELGEGHGSGGRQGGDSLWAPWA